MDFIHKFAMIVILECYKSISNIYDIELNACRDYVQTKDYLEQ